MKKKVEKEKVDKYNPDVLYNFWFGIMEETPEYLTACHSKWFEKNKEYDLLVRDMFLDFLTALEDGRLEYWKETPRGLLCYVILCDQIPRNAFRDTTRAFQYDKMAETISLNMCDTGTDTTYCPIERIFLYLPLEHSEDPSLQLRSVDRFQQLREDAPENLKDAFQETYDFAKRHYDTIHKFHRFPHRNKVLQRNPSEEEVEFLEDPKNNF